MQGDGSVLTFYRRILVPFDGSDGARRALSRALSLARDRGAEVITISVDEHTPRYAKGVGEVEEEDALREQYFAELTSEATRVAEQMGMGLRTVTAVGHAAQSILQCARDQGAELIVIGHSGHSGLWGSLLGSTTARVVDQAECDVLVVK
jgi:nucleotide-binding universal stress UspA family protein